MGTVIFPEGFVWGAGTSAYQIEGAVDEGGRGPSIWDTFAASPGAILGGHTGARACEHYHRHAEDVRLMRELGLRHYRLSVAWSRVQPGGSGGPNPDGLDFYAKLVDELLQAGITPVVTLYHWDLPQALEDLGGWTNRDTAHRFAEFTQIVHGALGDRVGTWLTVNEPWVAAFLGYGIGLHAPGRTSAAAAFQASHHLLLAHGLGTQALRAGGAERVGIALNLAPILTPDQVNDPGLALSPEDADAVGRVDCLLNRQYLDPVLRGRYPEELLPVVERFAGLGHLRDGDLEAIGEPIDLLGVNYYTPTVVRAQPGAEPNVAFPGSEGIAFTATHAATTAMGWPIVPNGLSLLLRHLAREHPGVELVVTENGAAFADVATEDGVHDADRIAFLDVHLRAVHDAMEQGAPVTGYFVWSLLDNFEWSEGYERRFGIVHVDFDTQRRRPKDSALWYRDVIRRNGLHLDRPKRPTLETVAARAGVSRATVSRVINGEASVGPAVRGVVMRVVSELGYVPNSAARSLVTRRTNTVALVLSGHVDDATAGTVVRCLGEALQGAGVQLTLMLAGSTAGRRQITKHVAAGYVDGVVLVPGPGDDALIEQIAGTGVPAVALGRHAMPSLMPFVDSDGVAGAGAAVRHLLEGGRRRIAMICGPLDRLAMQGRLDGYRDALARAGHLPLVAVGDLGRHSGQEAARRLITDHPGLDAVFAANDQMAAGALAALRAAGRSVPSDVAVVGFGDTEIAACTTPPLTTVLAPVSDQATALARLLLARLDGRHTASVFLPATLVRRESS